MNCFCLNKSTPTDARLVFKVVVIGDSGVGKTSIIRRCVDGTFPENPSTISGNEWHIRPMEHLDLELWDVSEHDGAAAYCQGTDGLIIAYDITSRESFERVDAFLAGVNASLKNDSLKVLLGNKYDKTEERIVYTEEGMMKANALGMTFFESSAKDYTNIEEGLEFLAHKLGTLRKQNP